MPLKVPKQAIPAIRQVLSMSDGAFDRLIEELKRAKPTLDARKLAAEVAKSAGLKSEEVLNLLNLLINLSLLKGATNRELGEFVQDVCDAVCNLGEPAVFADDASRNRFKDRLSAALVLDESVGVVAKGHELMISHQRVATRFRIITDLRPVFRSEVANGPSAALILHTLELEYLDSEKRQEFYVTLDLDDLMQLKFQIERALQKAQGIKSLISEKRISVFEGMA